MFVNLVTEDLQSDLI